MMAGVGTGGPAVGMFHLITHAFFKALLFLGAGSVIHGCHEEQDIARMGGLRKFMPLTFATYAIGMMALAGVPFFFSGFWSKDEILHSTSIWPVSRGPFVLLAAGTVLTAFYMTRQMCYVFFGQYRGEGAYSQADNSIKSNGVDVAEKKHHSSAGEPHESPSVMTWPLILLAGGAILVGFIGTPLWPWFQSFILGEPPAHAEGFSTAVLRVMAFSILLVASGILAGWLLYGRKPIASPNQSDALENWNRDFFILLRKRFMVDEFYEATVVMLLRRLSCLADLFDRYVWGGLVQLVTVIALGFAWFDRLFDEFVINLGFNGSSETFRKTGRWLSRFQNGQAQRYLRLLALSMAVLVILLLWGCKG